MYRLPYTLQYMYGYILEVGMTSLRAYMTITIKPEKLNILRLDIWGTVWVFIVDLNADIRGGFTNLTADYLPINAWFLGYYALIVLLWEA